MLELLGTQPTQPQIRLRSQPHVLQLSVPAIHPTNQLFEATARLWLLTHLIRPAALQTQRSISSKQTSITAERLLSTSYGQLIASTPFCSFRSPITIEDLYLYGRNNTALLTTARTR